MADINLKELLEEETSLPPLTRGKASEDYSVLIEAMRGGAVHSFKNVSEEDRAKVGQKIRGAAQRAGFKVTVRYSKGENKVYFQRIDLESGSDENASDSAETTSTSKTTSKK